MVLTRQSYHRIRDRPALGSDDDAARRTVIVEHRCSSRFHRFDLGTDRGFARHALPEPAVGFSTQQISGHRQRTGFRGHSQLWRTLSALHEGASDVRNPGPLPPIATRSGVVVATGLRLEGHGNPSIVDTEGMSSEGVGSYWPFATGRRVDQANILFRQVMETPDTMFVLIPNQHVGCWQTGFSPQWITREYLARRGSAVFPPGKVLEARCPLLGRTPRTIQVEGQTIGHWFLQVETQPEVGEEGYDRGAEVP